MADQETFERLGLDPRCARAARKRGLRSATAVQAQAIPHSLAGRDVVALAGTGTGKTAAYLLPLMHTLLGQANSSSPAGLPPPHALVLVPTSELASQVRAESASLCAHAGGDLRSSTLPPTGSPANALKAAARAAPDVLIATPARVTLCLRDQLFQSGAITRSLQFLVLDEADLLTGYGYSNDLQHLASHVPRSCRSMLVSATSKGNVDSIASMLLSNPVWLDASERPHDPLNSNNANNANLGSAGDQDSDSLSQQEQREHEQASVPSTIAHFRVECQQRDLMLHVLALIKLGSIKRKSLIFTSSAHSCVRLKLFLERFGVHCASVHGEQPRNSRDNTLAQFNKGLFDHLIAAESGRGDAEFGVARGIDFKGVRTVICVGIPESAEKYVHRAGRTGRAGRKGTSLVVAPVEKQEELDAVELKLKQRLGDDFALKPYPKLNRKTVESMRYRADDVLRSLGKNTVREARLRELRIELINSKKLEEHLASNPDDKSLLKHDRMLAKSKPPKHLAHVPDYIKPAEKKQRKSNIKQKASGGGRVQGKRKRKRGEHWEAAADPLLTRQTNSDGNDAQRKEKSGPTE